MAHHKMLKKEFFDTSDDNDYKKLGAWFLGSKGENHVELQRLLDLSLSWHANWRRDYFPQDPPYITPDIKQSKEYKEQLNTIERELHKISTKLQNSIPFFSSRYKGHMNWDVSMVGILAYFATMLYNPNNVAAEGSPVTTAIEHEVGKQLCNMLGYQKTDTLTPWGHITSCGTVANIESLWAARNVKYLPTAIFRALKEGSFKNSQDIGVTLANGQVKKVIDLTEWEMLNIPTDEALTLLANLNATYPPGEVLTALAKFDVQNQGMQNTKQGRYIVPISRHYSWEKAGAVLGIGQANMLKIQIDQHGRIDLSDLKRTIEECVRNQTPIIQLVVIVGSTAEGCVDPVTSILELRDEFRKQHNMDFHIHVDAAWGGYFCTMLKRQRAATGAFVSGMVPYLPLSKYVEQQLLALGSCDSCTVDPHKSGFIQYPAGALCYRNGSIRYLLTFQSPVIGTEGPDASIGIFGIEGSKAGAAVVATYLHHKVVGLDPRGHGRLLAQAHFTTKKIYALLATMASDDDPFTIALYTRPTSSPALLQKFVKSTNEDVLVDPTLMEEARNIGPDLHINAFCVNFSWPILSTHRTKNTSLELANKLIQTISDELNITESGSADDTTTPSGAARKRLFLIRNELGDQHKAVTTQLKQDLGIDPNAPGPMRYLVNTNMDPWPTATGFMDVFEFELRQSILRAIGSVKEDPHNHGFVVTDDATSTLELYGNHLPVFSEPQHNYHLVLKLQFQSANDKLSILQQYQDQVTRQVQQKNKPLILGNQKISTLHNLIYNKEFWTADVFCGFPSSANPPFTQVMLRVSDVLINEHFDPRSVYPKKEEYFIYGSQKRMYMSHCMVKYPDFHHVVELAIAEPPIDPLLLELGFKATVKDLDGGFKPNDPFKYDATTYDISYPFQGGIVRNIIRPLRSVWFDTEHLNVQHEHVGHGTREAAISVTSRVGMEGGVPARKEISTIVFDVLETLGTIQTKPDRTDFFRPHKRIPSILRQLRQQKKNLVLLLNHGIERETVQELAPFFTSIEKSLDKVLQQFSGENCLIVSENARLRRQAEEAGQSTLAYAHLVLHELKGEPLKLFKVLLPLNYKPDLVRDMLILHQFPMEWHGTTFLQTVAVMPDSKIKILQSQHWKVEPLDVKHPTSTELTASWISKESVQIKEDTVNALKQGHGDQIRLVSRIQPVLESKLEGVLNARFPEGDSWYLSLPQKQEFEEVMNSFKITPYNNRHVLSGVMNETTLALGKLLERYSQTTFQKFVLDSTQIHDVEQNDTDVLLNNVIGEIAGSSEEVVIISAHLDSTASFSYPQGYHPTEDLAPGQDDDGSGVAAVLLASKFFAERYKTKQPRRTIRFVLFNAEEHGLVGSQKYARMVRDYGDNVVAVFHMDMIGFNMRTKKFEVHVGLSSTPLTSLPKIEKRSIPLFHLIDSSWQELERAKQTTLERPELYTSRRGDQAARRSDHFSFHQVGYPACVVSEDFFPAGELLGEPNPNYHTANDNTVDPTYAVDIARVVIGAALLAVDS